MTTDKPKLWQSWIVYVAVGLLMMLVPYVGGYYLLGEHDTFYPGGSPRHGGAAYHDHRFEHDGLRKMFVPLAWAEAKIRGETVFLLGPAGDGNGYEGVGYNP